MNNILIDLIEQEIKVTEIKLAIKKDQLDRLRKKYSKRSLSKMFPQQSGNETFSIDQRIDGQ